MATIDITGLPAAVAVDGSEKGVCVQGGTTKQFELGLLSSAQFSLDSISTTQGAILYRGAADWVALTPGTSGYVLATQGAAADPIWTPNTAGSVVSVGLSLPGSVFSVSGSPVTSTGTLAGAFVDQSANTVFAGPTNGAATTPTFRVLVNADIATGGAALTRVDDTNVTVTLGGAPSTALVNAASLTLGWTGQLAVPRGGTGLASATAYAVLCGGTTSTGAFQSIASVGTTGQALLSNGAGALPSFQTLSTAVGAALTRVDDTNVTLTLGGTPATALLAATSITAGWTGTLSPARGGTGVANNAASTLTISGNFASTFTLTGVTGVTFPTSGTLATTSQILTPGGSDTQLQYNNAGAFGGISGATTNGTVVTLASPVLTTSPTAAGATWPDLGTVTTVALATVTGAVDMGGATSLEIPNSAAPTVNADGEIALDTTITNFAGGAIKYYSGAEFGLVGMPVAQFGTPADGDVVTYSAATDEFVLLPAGAGTGATRELDNLQNVAINTSLLSDTNNTDDIGDATFMWRSGYFATSIELGHATDNTLTAASGILSVEGVAQVNLSASQTLTNKTLTSPVIGTSPTAAGATWTDLGLVTVGQFTALRFADATGIYDDSGNEQLLFQKTASAVTYWEMTNNSTGTPPTLQALGEANTEGTITANGTGGIRFTSQPYCPQATLTDQATIAWNLTTQPSAIVTLTDNRTLDAPTNQKAGSTYILVIKQDGTGGRTLAWNAAYKFPGGVDPTLSTGINDVDVVSFVSDGTNMYGVAAFDFS